MIAYVWRTEWVQKSCHSAWLPMAMHGSTTLDIAYHEWRESWDVKYGAKWRFPGMTRRDGSQLHLLYTQWKDVDQCYVSGRNFYLYTLYTAR